MSRPRSTINPFYALVVLTGVVFVITTLAYVAAMVVVEPLSNVDASAVHDSPVLRFVEQRGESMLLWEAGALAVAAILAMGLDRWRSGNSQVGHPQRDQKNAGDSMPRE